MITAIIIVLLVLIIGGLLGVISKSDKELNKLYGLQRSINRSRDRNYYGVEEGLGVIGVVKYCYDSTPIWIKSFSFSNKEEREYAQFLAEELLEKLQER